MRICRTAGPRAAVRAPSCRTALILRHRPPRRHQATVRRRVLARMKRRGAAPIAARTRPRGAVRMRPRGAVTLRRTGRPTPRRAAARRATAAPRPVARRPVAAGRLLAARRLMDRGPRHAPARTGRYGPPSPRPAGLPRAGLPRQAVRKPGPVLARTAWAAGGSTGSPSLLSPHREAPRGLARPCRQRTAGRNHPAGPHRARPSRTTERSHPAGPHRARPPRTTERSHPAEVQPDRTTSLCCPVGPHRARSPRTRARSHQAGPPPDHTSNPGGPVRPQSARTAARCRPSVPSPGPRNRRFCRARPPCRTAGRGCPAGPDRNTPPGPRTTARPRPGRGSPAARRATDVLRHKDRRQRARRRPTGHGRTTRVTHRRAWPSPGSHPVPAAPPLSRPIHPGTAGAAPSAATRHGRASLILSTHRASSPRGTAPPPAPRGLVPRAGRTVPPGPRRSPGTRPSR
jgi:hypothetical protein